MKNKNSEIFLEKVGLTKTGKDFVFTLKPLKELNGKEILYEGKKYKVYQMTKDEGFGQFIDKNGDKYLIGLTEIKPIPRELEELKREVEFEYLNDFVSKFKYTKWAKEILKFNFFSLEDFYIVAIKNDIKFYEDRLDFLRRQSPEEFFKESNGADLAEELSIFREILLETRKRLDLALSANKN